MTANPVVNYSVAVADPDDAANVIRPNADGSVNVEGSITVDPASNTVATGSITIADTGSTTTTGLAGGSSAITGTPTAASFVSIAVPAGYSSVGILISGTWTGTIDFERSIDAGTTWTPYGAHISGSSINVGSTTLNGLFVASTATNSQFRVRATATVTGTANIRLVTSVSTDVVYLGNGVTPASTGTMTSVAGAASSTTILAANASRRGATVFNDSTAILYLALSATTASTTAYSVQIPAGDYYEVPTTTAGVYTGQLTGIWASATGNARVTELT